MPDYSSERQYSKWIMNEVNDALNTRARIKQIYEAINAAVRTLLKRGQSLLIFNKIFV